MAYPTTLDTFVTPVDGVTEIVAAHKVELNDAVTALQTKVGVDGSAVVTTIDHLLKSAASVDPGHHHTNASIDSLGSTKLTYSGLTSGHALIASGASAASFRAIQEADIVDGSILARLAADENISGQWDFLKHLTVKQDASGVVALEINLHSATNNDAIQVRDSGATVLGGVTKTGAAYFGMSAPWIPRS